jgi:hypothetical protein
MATEAEKFARPPPLAIMFARRVCIFPLVRATAIV